MRFFAVIFPISALDAPAWISKIAGHVLKFVLILFLWCDGLNRPILFCNFSNYISGLRSYFDFRKVFLPMRFS